MVVAAFSLGRIQVLVPSLHNLRRRGVVQEYLPARVPALSDPHSKPALSNYRGDRHALMARGPVRPTARVVHRLSPIRIYRMAMLSPLPLPLHHHHPFMIASFEHLGKVSTSPSSCASQKVVTNRSPDISDALINSILVRTHPTIPLERRFRLEIPAHPRFSQQNITVHLPAGHSRLQLIPRIAYLEQQHRQYRIFVAINNQFVGRATPLPIPDDPLPANAMVFECNLQPGTNQITVTMIAALPKGQKLPGGEDCELERFVINAYLPKA